MKKLVHLTVLGLLVVPVLATSLGTQQAHAATTLPRESITLSPVNKRYQLDAGSTKTDELTIVNDGETAYDFILYARPYSIQNNSYTSPDFTSTVSNADAYKWVQFTQARYHIEAGKTLKVPFTVRVPKDTAPGGHYGVVFAETQPSNDQSGSSVARKKRVGMIIYATINGQYRMAGNYLGSTVPFLQFHAPLKASTTVKNDGNSDFLVSTTYKVSDLFGQVKYQVAKDHPVLPQTKREMTFEWQAAPWFGLYKAEVNISYLDKKESASGYVLMAPRWLLILLSLVVVGGVLYAVLRRRR